jgi:hypothetical protein
VVLLGVPKFIAGASPAKIEDGLKDILGKIGVVEVGQESVPQV